MHCTYFGLYISSTHSFIAIKENIAIMYDEMLLLLKSMLSIFVRTDVVTSSGSLIYVKIDILEIQLTRNALKLHKGEGYHW